jgi:hypothetical protein
MYRKILTFVNESGDKQRIYFRDGVCHTPQAFEKVTANESGYSWNGIKSSGDTSPVERLKHRRRIAYGPVEIPAEFAGQQNPPRAVKASVLDSEGQPKAPRQRGLVISTETLDEIKKLAEEGKTLKQTELETGVSYAKLTALGKEYGLMFVKGKKGRQASGVAKALDPELVAKVKVCVADGFTVSQTTKQLGVAWFEIVKVAKAENLVFVKGARGRHKNNSLVELVAV